MMVVVMVVLVLMVSETGDATVCGAEHAEIAHQLSSVTRQRVCHHPCTHWMVFDGAFFSCSGAAEKPGDAGMTIDGSDGGVLMMYCREHV